MQFNLDILSYLLHGEWLGFFSFLRRRKSIFPIVNCQNIPIISPIFTEVLNFVNRQYQQYILVQSRVMYLKFRNIQYLLERKGCFIHGTHKSVTHFTTTTMTANSRCCSSSSRRASFLPNIHFILETSIVTLPR